MVKMCLCRFGDAARTVRQSIGIHKPFCGKLSVT